MNKRNQNADVMTGNDVANDMATPSEIRQDAAGRYCLNDIYALFKRKPERDPSTFLGLTQTQGLIMALREKQGANGVAPIVTTDASEGLTFAVEFLAMDYAAWICPEVRHMMLRSYCAPSGCSTADALAQAMEDFRQSEERAGAFKPH